MEQSGSMGLRVTDWAERRNQPTISVLPLPISQSRIFLAADLAGAGSAAVPGEPRDGGLPPPGYLTGAIGSGIADE